MRGMYGSYRIFAVLIVMVRQGKDVSPPFTDSLYQDILYYKNM